MGSVMRVVHELKENYDKAKAELKGEARSVARIIKPFAAFGTVRTVTDCAPVPVKGAVVRMLDGKPMVFYGDGSIRHITGHKPGKAARKALKRERQRHARTV